MRGLAPLSRTCLRWCLAAAYVMCPGSKLPAAFGPSALGLVQRARFLNRRHAGRPHDGFVMKQTLACAYTFKAPSTKHSTNATKAWLACSIHVLVYECANSAVHDVLIRVTIQENPVGKTWIHASRSTVPSKPSANSCSAIQSTIPPSQHT